jgi:CRP-like cAMP-binding protein
MKAQFFSYLEQFTELSIEQKQLLAPILQPRTHPQQSLLLPEGSVADSYFFVCQGALRSYLLQDGQDITDYFFFENSLASDYASLFAQKPTLFFLETLEPSQLLHIKRDDLLALGQQDPFFHDLNRGIAEGAFVELEERLRLFHLGNLETRYRWMMQQFPQVFQRIPQYHIASYLGVKPESLSRIKRKLGTTV